MYQLNWASVRRSTSMLTHMLEDKPSAEAAPWDEAPVGVAGRIAVVGDLEAPAELDREPTGAVLPAHARVKEHQRQ